MLSFSFPVKEFIMQVQTSLLITTVGMVLVLLKFYEALFEK